MKTNLMIDAVRYDFNRDKLRQVVDGKFDIVLIRHAINFCKDIRELALELKQVVKPDGIIYVSFVVPTIPSCLR